MMISAKEFDSRLLALDPQSVDFEWRADELLTQADLSKPEEVLNSIFNFFERYPHEDAGAPGPLVHFAEQYYPAYKSRLLASLFNAPSVGAVLMTNRILNSKLSRSEQQEYLSALKGVVANPRASPIVQGQAEHFLAYQSSKSA